MEESDLLKKRVQAITEKHHIQQLIRMKKAELDGEKVKLQQLKKKALREQWLLQDSASDTFQQHQVESEQQKTRALQLHIHSIEMDIYSLEREESRISTNEKLILNRLKAVEKSPEELIREVQVSFVPAMEVSGEALSTGERLTELSGLKNSQQGSHDMSCISDLSASEVEQLLKSATVHRQGNHQQLGRVGPCFYEHHEGCDVRNHRQQYDNCVTAENNSNRMEKWQEHSQRERHYDDQEARHFGNHGRERPQYGTRPSYHHNEGVTAYQPQLGDYISVEEEECCCYSPPSQTKNNHNPTAFGRLPSARYRDDSSYTSLNNLDATQSITAVFMGFQAAEADSRKSPEFVGSLKAELIIIEDSGENKEDDVKRKKSHGQLGVTERAASENVGFIETQMGQSTRKFNKHKPCCAVC